MTTVGAAQGVDVDPLHAGGVHGDGALDAEEPEPVPVRRQVELLVARGAVEDHRVGAVLAFDGVAAVTVVPDERIVAVAHEGHVAALVSVDRVVAVAAQQRLSSRASDQAVVAVAAAQRPRPGASDQLVVSVATLDRRRDAVAEDPVAFIDTHEIVAVAGVDSDPGDARELEVEVGRAVIADVDLEDAGLAELQPKRDPVARVGALDCQHTVHERRLAELSLLQ